MALLGISRSFSNYEHQQLRSHMSEVNRLGDLSIKWRRLGEAGLTLLERGEYASAIHIESSQLSGEDTNALATEYNNAVLPGMPHGNTRLSAQVVDVAFLGDDPFRSIAYILESPELSEQREYITRITDEKNGVPREWREYIPHVSVATIPAYNCEDRILDEFWRFVPQQFTLLMAIAKSS